MFDPLVAFVFSELCCTGTAMLAELEGENPDPHTRLYPGDRLVEVDGLNIENASRDIIVSRIRNAGDEITLVVQSVQDDTEIRNASRYAVEADQL